MWPKCEQNVTQMYHKCDVRVTRADAKATETNLKVTEKKVGSETETQVNVILADFICQFF